MRRKEGNVFTTIRKVLGEPYVSTERCLLYQMDCVEAMKALNDVVPECVDLTVTSPPYNIGKEYEKVLPLDEYLAWCEGWMGEVYDLTTSNGAFWLNLGLLGLISFIAINVYAVWQTKRLPRFLQPAALALLAILLVLSVLVMDSSCGALGLIRVSFDVFGVFVIRCQCGTSYSPEYK